MNRERVAGILPADESLDLPARRRQHVAGLVLGQKKWSNGALRALFRGVLTLILSAGGGG